MAATGKFVIARIHPKMPRIADIDQAIVAPPAIAVDDAPDRHLAEDNGL